MKGILKLIILLLALPVQAENWRTFEVSSHPGFGVQGSGNGQIKITKECVCFKVATASAWVLPQLEKYSTKVVGIRFGLAYEANGEIWDVLGYSPIKPIDEIVSTNNPIELSTYETSMPVPKNLESKRYWVLMQVVKKHRKDKSYTYSYAHEEEGFK